MKVIRYAPDAMRLLNGIFCVYKPAGISSLNVISTLRRNLSRDLNDMKVRPVRDYVEIEGNVASGKPFSVKVRPNFADHPLVVGPRYQPQDFRFGWMYRLGTNTSGVFVLAINEACRQLKLFQESNYLRTFEAKGKFGFATDTFFENGKVLEKTTYDHISHERIDRTLASIQAAHQALAFQYSGVSLQSQEAYILASKGIIRPAGESCPIIYGICCTDFNLPDFTLEIHCINETEEFLAELVHQIGIYLRSTAVCCQLRQTRFGNFTLDHALIRKHWNVQHILSNIMLCKDIANVDSSVSSTAHFKPTKTEEIRDSFNKMQEQLRSQFM